MTIDPIELFYELGGRNEAIESDPIQRQYTHDVKGMVLYMPRTGLTLVPHTQHVGGWDCVVVDGNETYPRGGYDLFIPDNEIKRGIQATVIRP